MGLRCNLSLLAAACILLALCIASFPQLSAAEDVAEAVAALGDGSTASSAVSDGGNAESDAVDAANSDKVAATSAAPKSEGQPDEVKSAESSGGDVAPSDGDEAPSDAAGGPNDDFNWEDLPELPLSDLEPTAYPGFPPQIAQLFGTSQDLQLDESAIGKEEEIVENLLTWMKDNGAEEIGRPDFAIKVVVDRNSSVYAARRSRAKLVLTAARDIPEGQTILSIPSSLWVTSNKEAVDVLPFYNHTWTQATLIAWLLRERAKGAASFWSPFIRSLPDYTPLPFLYDEETVNKFEDDALMVEINRTLTTLGVSYELIPDETRVANASWSRFLWSASIAMSRQFPALHLFPPSASSDSSPPDVQQPSLEYAADKSEEEAEKRRGTQFVGPHVMFLPLMDNLAHDGEGWIGYKVVNGSFRFFAQNNISKGAVLATPYGALTSDQLLMTYGFVPPGNAHDGIIIFRNRRQLVDFFRKTFFGKGWHGFIDEATYDILDNVDDAVERELQKEKYQPLRGLPEFTFYRGMSYYVWAGGRLDPRMFGGMAATHSHLIYDKIPKWEDLAAGTVRYGWIKSPNSTCDDLAAWVDNLIVDSFPVAAEAIRRRAADFLNKYSTTYSEDLNALEALASCRAAVLEGRGQEVEGCDGPFIRTMPEMENILAFRIARKSILLTARFRLQKTCEFTPTDD